LHSERFAALAAPGVLAPLEPGGDDVAANGVSGADAVFRKPDHNLHGDASVMVDLAMLLGEAGEPLSTIRSSGSTLILGCAARLTINIGAVELAVEVQRSWRQFRGGMMFREQLTDAEGMLFFNARPERLSFYMKNTKSPQSCAYIDPAGVIQELDDMKPFNRTSIRASSVNIQFVLEAKQGWFTWDGVTIETGILIKNKTPREIFWGAEKRRYTAIYREENDTQWPTMSLGRN